MRNDEHLSYNLPTGSGVIEAAGRDLLRQGEGSYAKQCDSVSETEMQTGTKASVNMRLSPDQNSY